MKTLDAEHLIERLARYSKQGHDALWDFGIEYQPAHGAADFSYAEANRAAKQQFGVDLVPAPTATKVVRALETFHDQARVPLEELRKLSPYTCYDVSRLVELTPANVEHYLSMMRTMTRDDLITALADDPEAKEAETATITVDANVAEMMKQAREVFAQAAGREEMSATMFVEIVSQLVLDSSQAELLKLWRRVHGDEEG